MDKYEVKIVLSVNRVAEDGKKSDFFDSDVKYSSIPYEGVVAIEQLMLGILQETGKWGVNMAVSNGLGDRLKELGVKV